MGDPLGFGIAMAVKAAVVVFINEWKHARSLREAEASSKAKQAKVRRIS